MNAHRITRRGPCQEAGLTLIEIMVALAISAVLLTGVMQIFLASKQTYRVQEGLSRLQENARFGMNFLSENIRMAGYTGCGSRLPAPTNMADVNGDGIPDAAADFTIGALQGYEYGDLPVTLTDTSMISAAEVQPNTDVIVIMSGSPSSSFQLIGNMVTVNANIQISAAATGMFQPNDILFISDCTDSDVFAANNVSGGGTITIAHSNAVNIGNFLSKTYGADALIMKLNKVAYYVGPNASGTPALFRKRLGTGSATITEELVDGAENLQILYGEDMNGDNIADRFINATGVTAMDNVVAVRLALLMQTVEEVDTNTNTSTYTLLDVNYDPADDRRLRRNFTKTVKIRNRGLM